MGGIRLNTFNRYHQMSGHGFLNLPSDIIADVNLDRTPKRYKITLDLTLEDSPDTWDFEDLLEIEDSERINYLSIEEY